MDTGISCIQSLLFGLAFGLDSLWKFLDSNFFTAFAGALAGAYGAHHIADRARIKQEILAEIRNTNVAITIAVGISQSLLSLKKQIVKPFMDDFKEAYANLLAFKEAQAKGAVPPGVAHYFRADMRSITPTSVPQAILQEYVFDKLNWSGRPLVVTNTLNRSIDGLANSILERNTLVEALKPLVGSPDDLAPLYFGIPDKRGYTDSKFPDMLKAIYDQTDDGIFFSNLLYRDLREHGEKLSTTFKNKFRAEAPTIHKLEYTDPETQSLLPDESKYRDWLNNFSKQEPKQSWLARKVAQIRRLLSPKVQASN